MLALIIALVALLVVTGIYVSLPALREEEGDESAAAREGSRPAQASGEVEREIRWRLEHDREAGRLGEEEYQRELARLDGRGEAGDRGEH